MDTCEDCKGKIAYELREDGEGTYPYHWGPGTRECPENSTATVLQEIHQERERQNIKWGEQHHPDGTDIGQRRYAESYKRICDKAAAKKKVTWKDILLEEVYEALAEEDFDRLTEELIQVAAVAVAWVEDIKSREATKIPGGNYNGCC